MLMKSEDKIALGNCVQKNAGPGVVHCRVKGDGGNSGQLACDMVMWRGFGVIVKNELSSFVWFNHNRIYLTAHSHWEWMLLDLNDELVSTIGGVVGSMFLRLSWPWLLGHL
jgi:hypothetical protein